MLVQRFFFLCGVEPTDADTTQYGYKESPDHDSRTVLDLSRLPLSEFGGDIYAGFAKNVASRRRGTVPKTAGTSCPHPLMFDRGFDQRKALRPISSFYSLTPTPSRFNNPSSH